MRQVVTGKMARVLAECCTYHERLMQIHVRQCKEAQTNCGARVNIELADTHKKYADVIQELMARRMVIQGKAGR